MNLIFDFDGVIADSEEAFNDSLSIAFKQAGFAFSKVEIELYTDLQYFETIVKLARNNKAKVRKYFMKEIFKKIRKGDYLFPFAQAALADLSRRHRMFVVSNSYQLILEECASVYSLRFEEMVGRCKRFLRKETGLRYLLKKYQLGKNETAYVGDSCGDVELARKLGVQVYAVFSGWDSKGKLEFCKPDKIFKNIFEMAKLI